MAEISENGAQSQTPVTDAQGETPPAPAEAPKQTAGWQPASSQAGDPDDGIRGRSARQYIGSLRATYAAVCAKRERTGGADFPPNLKVGIEAILAKYYESPGVNWTAGETWDDAYQLELLMINVLDAERLDVELEAKLKEAKDKGVPSAAQFEERRKAQAQAQEQAQAHALEQALALARAQGQTQSSDEAEKRAKEQAEEQVKVRIDRDRAMLQRLTEDLQWFYNTRDQRRRYAQQAQWRASVTFALAMLLFGTVMFNTFSFGPMIEQRAEESKQRELASLTARRLAERVKMQAEAETARMNAAEAERREMTALRMRRLTEQVKMQAEAEAARMLATAAEKAERDSNALTALEASKAQPAEIQTTQGEGQ